MISGTILFDSKFQFPNGRTDYKLILILATYGTNFLVVQTTRQKLSKTENPGCQISNKPPNYFIPKHSSWFEDDTWVLLDEVFEYDGIILGYKKEDGIVTHKHTLPSDVMKNILECALKSLDIDIYWLQWLEEAYDGL